MSNSLKKLLPAIFVVLLLAIVAGYYYFNSKEPEVENLPIIKIAFSAQNLDSVPILIADKRGYFEDQGVRIELIQASGSEAAVALGGGQVDLAVMSAPRIYSPIEKGVPVKILSPMSNTDSQLFVRPDSGLTKVKDLEGKKVSYGSSGGTKELFIKSILNKEGVDISKITFVEVDNTFLHVALMDKMVVDAIMIQDAHYVDEAEKLGAIVLPEWIDKNYAKTTTGLTISVNTDYLDNNEDNVRKFFNALIEGHRYLKNNLDEASIIVSDTMTELTNGAFDIKAEDFVTQVTEGNVSYVIWEDTTNVLGMAKVSYDIGTLTKLPVESELYDFRFKTLLESAQNEIYGTKAN